MKIIVDWIWVPNIRVSINGRMETMRKGINDISVEKGKSTIVKIASTLAAHPEVQVENASKAVLRISIPLYAKVGMVMFLMIYLAALIFTEDFVIPKYWLLFTIFLIFLQRYSFRIVRLS